MAESAASGPLHMLMAELNGAKSQWEYLHDRLTNGYKDARKRVQRALKAKSTRITARDQTATLGDSEKATTPSQGLSLNVQAFLKS